VSTFFSALGVLAPVLFVLALGYCAGRMKRFDSDQVAGLNELVLGYALPALLFVGIARAPRAALFSEAPFVLALLVAGLGLFVAVALVSVFLLRHTLSAAAIQSASVTLSNVGFAGVAILTPLFGQDSLLSIAVAALVLNVTIIPVMVTMLEYDRHRSLGGGVRLGALIGRSVADSFSQPYVWAPLLALILVLLGVRVPKEIDSMLALIGSATGGAALFVAGIILAAFRITVTFETVGNTLVKVVVQPVIMALLVIAFGIAQPLRAEAIVICALSSAVVCPMLAVRYKAYQAEAASTLLLTTLAMVVAVPIAITLAR
jgi:malonate transporter